jgi:hypothetical protein
MNCFIESIQLEEIFDEQFQQEMELLVAELNESTTK